jgi:hypothetical protein
MHNTRSPGTWKHRLHDSKQATVVSWERDAIRRLIHPVSNSRMASHDASLKYQLWNKTCATRLPFVNSVYGSILSAESPLIGVFCSCFIRVVMPCRHCCFFAQHEFDHLLHNPSSIAQPCSFQDHRHSQRRIPAPVSMCFQRRPCRS